jgi:hypothetical protein
MSTKISPLYNINRMPEWVYSGAAGKIYGVPMCCSAAVFAAPYASMHLTEFLQKHMADEIAKIHTPVEQVNSIADYFRVLGEVRRTYGSTPYEATMEIVHLRMLEMIYNKAKRGEGGQNMHAGNAHATKTWVMADSDSSAGDPYVSVHSLCDWLWEQEWREMVRLEEVTGAHGGTITTWVVTFNLTCVKKLLNQTVIDINAHIKYVNKCVEDERLHRGLGRPYVANKYTTENEAIHNMWT